MKNASLAALLSFALLAPAAAFGQAAPTLNPPTLAAPTLAPTPAPATVLQPAGTPPAADQASTPAPEAPKADPNKWAGSSLYTTFSFPTSGIFRGQQQTPDVGTNYFLRVSPRYQVSKAWQIRANIGGSVDVVEGINSSTTYSHEFLFSDPAFQFFYMGIPKLPGGIRMIAGPTLRLPLSKVSWAQGLIAAPGLTTQFAKPFASMGGDTLLVAQVAYQRPIYMAATPTTTLPYPRATYTGVQSFGASEDQFTGAVNVRDSMSLLLLGVQSWGKWQPGFFFLASAQVPYDVKDLGLAKDNTTSWRVRGSTFLAAFLDYEVNDWFIPEVGYQMQRSVLDADGTYGNPFFGQYQATQVYIGANVQLDVLYKTLKGDGAEGGVVRASRTPIGVRF